MHAPVTLPRLSWGPPAAQRRALLVHGLGSDGALMWRFGTTLADLGWCAEAVDLRGHGRGPRTLDYTLEAYGADVATTTAEGGWDLVVGHSLGGAATVLAAAAHPAWARHLILVDPAVILSDHDRDVVRASQTAAFADPTVAAVAAEHPHWHPIDIELKAKAAQAASRWAVEQTSEQNPVWDVRDSARALSVPTHVIGSDPRVYTIFPDSLADELSANPSIRTSRVRGAGHSPHRDDPSATMTLFGRILADWFPA